MFKKLKDKLAEEVKSSPQRIQQFAQAAQAAVTSASSSISDITNNDLFSIGDSDSQQPRPTRLPPSPTQQQSVLQDVSLLNIPNSLADMTPEMNDNQRQRRFSNSSMASDVSFRLPNYETPSMYHLQSDIEVSASEADETGFSGSPATLDRVSKEQLYAAYRRMQERYKKYRTQYGDLARHYKLLERENAKARSVLVETQDKALRRISELKEQCSLEQSAKAHLENALRIEIEEKSSKIETLNKKLEGLQSESGSADVTYNVNDNSPCDNENGNMAQLITFEHANPPQEDPTSELTVLNNKIEKMEQLINKYKDSLKTNKDKNAQITTELQILSKELENKNKQILELKTIENRLNEANKQIADLKNDNEDLQNQVNAYDFSKAKQQSTLEIDLQKANEEILELRAKIDTFSTKEEEYAISLAENKLRIHKELETKESEIKSLKSALSASQNEMQSLIIVNEEYKKNISLLETETNKLKNDCIEFNNMKSKMDEVEIKMQELTKKSASLEQHKVKLDEEVSCLQLQLKQETAEKLAMVDRNTYLESRNAQLTEENSKKSAQITKLEFEIHDSNTKHQHENANELKAKENKLSEELNISKEKCHKLELEIQEEREELVKLQAEIEKLLSHHESIQAQNAEALINITRLTSENSELKCELDNYKHSITTAIHKVVNEIKDTKKSLLLTAKDTKCCLESSKDCLSSLSGQINDMISTSNNYINEELQIVTDKYRNLKCEYDGLQAKFSKSLSIKSENTVELSALQKENADLLLKVNSFELDSKELRSKLEKASDENTIASEKIQDLSNDKDILNKKIEEIESICDQYKASVDKEKSHREEILEQLKSIESEKQAADDTFKSLQLEKESSENRYKDTIKGHEKTLQVKEKELIKIQELYEKLKQESLTESNLNQQLQLLEIEKLSLINKLKSEEENNLQITKDRNHLQDLHRTAIGEIEELRNEVQIKSKELLNCQEMKSNLEHEIAQYRTLNDKIKSMENENENWTHKVNDITLKNKQIQEELDFLTVKYNTTNDNINELNITIDNKTKESYSKQMEIDKMSETIKIISHENNSLKEDIPNFINNIKKLESEIDDIRKSHTEIEKEKDRLSKVIEQLENTQNEKAASVNEHKDTQTELNNDVSGEPSAVSENKWLVDNKPHAKTTAPSLAADDTTYSNIQVSYDKVKDENKRLHSDIEGLQSYLTKISKENSLLNDKLRELIASSENSTENELLSNDLQDLKQEVQICKDKYDELLRENSLLVEENLELKDQLQSQHYSKYPLKTNDTDDATHNKNDKDLNVADLKYDDLLQANDQLEKRYRNLEEYNKSVSGNVQQLEENNERLRHSNEKLERRLDEALVSLRHLHSLQENTELEYLRNILYEYLTGSGSHSVTLAKVLAAIVKFDDGQTQAVLQKEKERQGFLRQLGII